MQLSSASNRSCVIATGARASRIRPVAPCRERLTSFFWMEPEKPRALPLGLSGRFRLPGKRPLLLGNVDAEASVCAPGLAFDGWIPSCCVTCIAALIRAMLHSQEPIHSELYYAVLREW